MKDARIRRGELLLFDGLPAGYVTSAAYGPALGQGVTLGFADDHTVGTVRVEVGGALYSAQIGVKAPYDPSSSRVKA